MTETSSLRAGPAAGVVASPTRVLLVEDDEGDAFLVRELLLDAGADIELPPRPDPGGGRGEAAGRRSTACCSTWGFPTPRACRRCARSWRLAPTIAVLVLTGLVDEHRGIEAVAAGAQDYLVKGTIDGQLLTRAIRYAVERKRADESIRRLYESEARAAENARLERGLLPQPLVSSHGVDVVARYRPGRHQSLLGGDFYDVVECEDGSLFALIGDVAGHGPDEAALGVCLRIAWRTLVLAGADPETILSSMDSVLISERGSDEIFATVSMVRVESSRRTARFWLAGHPLPVILDGTVERVPDEAAGTALGIVDGRPGPASTSRSRTPQQPDALHRRPDRGLRRTRRPPPAAATGSRDGLQRLLRDLRPPGERAPGGRAPRRGAATQRRRTDRRRGCPVCSPGPTGSDPSTLRRRLVIAFLALAAVIAVGVTVAVVSAVQLYDAQNQVTDRLFTAYSLAGDLNQAVVDEETGFRGYALTRDEAFLEPYRDRPRPVRRGQRAPRHDRAGLPRPAPAAGRRAATVATLAPEVVEPGIAAIRAGKTSTTATLLARQGRRSTTSGPPIARLPRCDPPRIAGQGDELRQRHHPALRRARRRRLLVLILRRRWPGSPSALGHRPAGDAWS